MPGVVFVVFTSCAVSLSSRQSSVRLTWYRVLRGSLPYAWGGIEFFEAVFRTPGVVFVVFTSSVASRWYPKIIKLNNTHEIVKAAVKISIPVTPYGIVPHIKYNSVSLPTQAAAAVFFAALLSCNVVMYPALIIVTLRGRVSIWPRPLDASVHARTEDPLRDRGRWPHRLTP